MLPLPPALNLKGIDATLTARIEKCWGGRVQVRDNRDKFGYR
jgi:hypothetical protein